MDDLVKNGTLKMGEIPKNQESSPIAKKGIFGILSVIIFVITAGVFGMVVWSGFNPIFFAVLGISIAFFIYCIKNRSRVGGVALFFSSIVPIITVILLLNGLSHLL